MLAVENFVAGPFASMWLADAGAEVVKVESPEGGDFSRSTSPVKSDEKGVEQGLAFLRTNRNKRSLTLDLKHPEGKRLFRELAGHADVLVENLRPGVMDRLGLGWTELHALNPRLIYCAISGFGHSDVLPSPMTDRPAFDIVGQALSGLMYRPERHGDRPVYLGFSLADIQGGVLAAQGVAMALYERERTGVGRKVDISLVDACVALNEISIAMYSVFEQPSKPGVHAVTAPFGTYACSDGHIVIAVLGEHIWQRFCAAIGQPDLAHDERFIDGTSRRTNLEALDAQIAPWLAVRTRDEAVRALLDEGVPASKVNDVQDLFNCPHLEARNMLTTLDDPVWGKVRVAGNPIKMSGVPEMAPTHPPKLGADTDEVLSRWLGAAPGTIAAWRADGVL